MVPALQQCLLQDPAAASSSGQKAVFGSGRQPKAKRVAAGGNRATEKPDHIKAVTTWMRELSNDITACKSLIAKLANVAPMPEPMRAAPSWAECTSQEFRAVPFECPCITASSQ